MEGRGSTNQDAYPQQNRRIKMGKGGSESFSIEPEYFLLRPHCKTQF